MLRCGVQHHGPIGAGARTKHTRLTHKLQRGFDLGRSEPPSEHGHEGEAAREVAPHWMRGHGSSGPPVGAAAMGGGPMGYAESKAPDPSRAARCQS